MRKGPDGTESSLPAAVPCEKVLPDMAKCEQPFSLGKFLLAVALAGGVIFSSLLSVAPHLHEQLHPDASADHLCLATIFAGGQCESCASTPIFIGPDPLPTQTPLISLVASVPGPRFFSLLEHAPPVLA
jgi:hypothetical protein